jgi:hypothetical protein
VDIEVPKSKVEAYVLIFNWQESLWILKFPSPS